MKEPKERVVALVQCVNGIQHPNLFFQVTLDPDRMLPDSEYIRFGGWSDGKGQGDELTGWMRLSDWHIAHVIGPVDAAGKVTVTP